MVGKLKLSNVLSQTRVGGRQGLYTVPCMMKQLTSQPPGASPYTAHSRSAKSIL